MECKMLGSSYGLFVRQCKVIVTATNECTIAMTIIRANFQNTWENIKSNQFMKLGQAKWESITLSNPSRNVNMLQDKVTKIYIKTVIK